MTNALLYRNTLYEAPSNTPSNTIQRTLVPLARGHITNRLPARPIVINSILVQHSIIHSIKSLIPMCGQRARARYILESGRRQGTLPEAIRPPVHVQAARFWTVCSDLYVLRLGWLRWVASKVEGRYGDVWTQLTAHYTVVAIFLPAIG